MLTNFSTLHGKKLLILPSDKEYFIDLHVFLGYFTSDVLGNIETP